MSKTNAFSKSLLDLIFNATAIADLAENDATSPLTSLFVSLHTASPGETGTQTTNEIATAAYGQYARVGRTRTNASGGWTAATTADPAVTSPHTTNIDYAEMTTGTGGTITHFGVGTLASGAGVLLYHGTVTPNIVVAVGVTPRLTTATAIREA